MNRRDLFKSLLGGIAAASQLDLEKLLWVPTKTIFLPAEAEFTSPILYSDWVAAESVRLLLNNLRSFSREMDNFEFGDFAIGDKIIFKYPQRFTMAE